MPRDATKSSHKTQRDLFKACVLAVQYGTGEDSLGQRIGKPPIVARQLLKLPRSEIYIAPHARVRGRRASGRANTRPKPPLGMPDAQADVWGCDRVDEEQRPAARRGGCGGGNNVVRREVDPSACP